MKKSTFVLIALVFASAIITETYCSHKKNEKCIDDFEACTIDDECCSKFCSKGVNHTYTCNGDLNYVKKLVESGKMCLVDAYLSEEVDKQMAEDYGPLNVVLTRYPVGSIVNLTINDITRTVITNTLSKTPANVTVLALSQRVAKMFLVDKDGFVRCQYNVNHVQLPIQKESHGLISIELMICIFFGGLIILAMILPFMLPLL